jgi:hypothetical protein
MPGLPLGNLSEDCKVIPILNYASQSSSRNSEVIDTFGYRNCYIGIQNAAVADTAAATYKLVHSDAVTNETTLSGGADILGSSQAVNTTDYSFQYYDGRPGKRYIQLAVTADAAQLTAQTGFVVLYNSKFAPVTAAAGTSTVGEGTGAVAGEATFTGWTSGTA